MLNSGSRARAGAVGIGIGLGALTILLLRGLLGDGAHPFLAVAPAPAENDAAGWIGEETARRVFNLDKQAGRFVYDPIAGLRPAPNRVLPWTWKEHPEGGYVQETNDIGLVERGPVGPKRGPRILVAGDSHTAGLVANEETFANLLERMLSNDPGWEGVDVLNAGCAHTGPRCYLGTLEKYLDLDPDVFIATLFVGNDFFDDHYLESHLRSELYPLAEGEYKERILRARRRHPNPIYQGFNLPYRWMMFPEDRVRALELVVGSFLRMKAGGEEEGIRFIAIVLPTKMEVDDDDQEVQGWLLETLAMTRDDLEALTEIGDDFVSAMAEHGIACLDPRSAMRAHASPLYWSEDYHLGVRGHQLLAELLEAELLVGD